MTRTGSTIRAFFACRLAPQTINALRTRTRPIAAQFDQASIRWVLPQNLHLTLRFIGPMSMIDAEALRLPIDALAARAQPIRYRFGTLQTLPAIAPRVLALSVDGGDPLLEIAAAVDELVATPREHEFHPHVTLVRLSRPGRVLWMSLVEALSQIDVSDIDCCFDRVGLYRSDVSVDGPIYAPVFEAPFADYAANPS